MLSKITAATLAASLFALGGCAQTEPGTNAGAAADGKQAIATTGKAPSKTEANAPVAASNSAAQAAITNPAIIEFEEGVALDSQAQTLITQLATPVKRANKIVITGYADKRKAQNAKDLALSRAAKVKGELVKQGVVAKNIRLKYITDQTKNAAKIEWSGEPLKVVNSATPTPKN